MPSPTMLKFGYPETGVAETAHWSVQVRPGQVTLGALVLVCKDEAAAFSAISPEAFAELGTVVADIERVLAQFVEYERINYLMLMMVDPDVHFHVIPRYEGTRTFENESYPDKGWPGPPALGEAVSPRPVTLAALRDRLAALWTPA